MRMGHTVVSLLLCVQSPVFTDLENTKVCQGIFYGESFFKGYMAGDIVSVLLPLRLNKPFDYRVPENLKLYNGDIVKVFFGKNPIFEPSSLNE